MHMVVYYTAVFIVTNYLSKPPCKLAFNYGLQKERKNMYEAKNIMERNSYPFFSIM